MVLQLQQHASEMAAAIAAAYPNIPPPAVLLSVDQFAARNPVFTPPALRNLIFKATTRHSTTGIISGNGLIESGAVIRLGRKVLIDEAKFFGWVKAQQGGAK